MEQLVCILLHIDKGCGHDVFDMITLITQTVHPDLSDRVSCWCHKRIQMTHSFSFSIKKAHHSCSKGIKEAAYLMTKTTALTIKILKSVFCSSLPGASFLASPTL